MAPWYYAAGVVGVAFGLLVLSYLLRKYVRTVADYYVMGRRAPWILVTCTLTATWLSMWTFLGGAGVVWQAGPWYIQSWFIGSVSGIVLFALYLGPAFRRAGYLTIPDFFEHRFASKRVRSAAVAALIVGLYFYIVLQVSGGAIIFETVFGIPYVWGMLIFLVVVMICLLFSGMWSVVVSDAFGFTIFMTAAIALPVVVLGMCGGPAAAFAGAGKIQGAAYYAWAGKSGQTLPQILGNILSWCIILGSSPHLINRSLVARSGKDVYKACIGTLVAGTACTFFLYMGFVGLVNLVPPGTVKPDWLAAHAAVKVLPAWLGVIYLMGAFAAGATTANTQYITCAQGVGRDLYQSLINPAATDRQVIAVTRWSVVGIAAATAVIAAIKPWLLIIAGTITGMIFAFGYFPAILLGLSWGRLTAKATEITLWTSVPLGVFAVYTWTKYKWFQPHPTIWGLGLGLVMLIVLSYLTQKTPQEEGAWQEARRVFWPQKPTLLRERGDALFLVGSAIAITVVGLIIMGIYRGWFGV